MTEPTLIRSAEDAAPVSGPWGNTAAAAQVYADLTDWLDGRRVALATDAADRIHEDLPAYRVDGLRADVVQHVGKIFGVFVATIREERDPVLEDFHWTAEHARHRVHHGISLVDFLTAFRIAQLTLWEAVLTWTEDHPGAEKDVLHLVSHLMRTIEGASSVAARTYLEAQQYDLADLENIQRALVDDLLAGRRPTRPRQLALLREAGLDDEQPYVVASAVLTDHSDSGTIAQEVLARSARTHLSRACGGVFALRDAELVAVVPTRGSDDRGLAQRLGRVVEELAGRGIRLSIGIGTTRTDLAAVPELHAEAVLARDSISAGFGVAAVADLSAMDYLLRRPDETAARFVRPAVRAFFVEDLAADGTYAESLRAYVDHDLNAREAARALHVHVNTLYYRLERISERTGRDLRRLDDVIELLLAIRVLSAP